MSIPSATAACAIATLHSIEGEPSSTPGRMCARRSINGRPSAKALAVPPEAGFGRESSFHEIRIIMFLATGPAAFGGTLCHKGD
jgi:hypothetical protein